MIESLGQYSKKKMRAIFCYYIIIIIIKMIKRLGKYPKIVSEFNCLKAYDLVTILYYK